MADLKFSFTADLSGFRAGMNDAVTAARGAVDRLRTSFAGLTSAADQPRESLSRFSTQGSSAVSGLTSKITGLVSIYAAFGAIKAITGVADEAALATARIQGLTGSITQTQAAQAALYEMSQRLQASYSEATASFARILPAVQNLGGGVQEATRLTEVLLTTAKLSGSSAAEATASAQQFAQALGSGALQGDELRSILENNNTLARTLAAGMGVTVGELKRLGAEGKLTSDLVGNTLLKAYDDIKSKASDLPQTVGGAWTQITNAFTKLVTATESGTGVFGTLGSVMREIARVVEAFAVAINSADAASTELGQEQGAKTFAQQAGQAFAYLGDVIGAVVRTAVEIVKGLIDVFMAAGEQLGAIAAAAAAVARGDFSAAGDIMEEAMGRGARAITRLGVAMGEGTARVVQAVTGAGPALSAYTRLLEDAAKAGGAEGSAPKPNTTLEGGAAAPGKKKKDKGRVDEWEEMLTEQKLAYAQLQQEQKTYQDFSVQQEIEFWRGRLAVANMTATERVAVERKITALELQEITRRNDQAASAQRTRQDMDKARALAEVDALENEARFKLQTKQITDQEFLAAELQFEAQRYEIRRQATEQLLELAKAEGRDPAEVERINEQLLSLELQYQQKRQQIQIEQRQGGAGLFGILPDQNTFEQTLGTLFDMTQTWGQKVQGIFRQMSATFTRELIIKPLSEMLMRYVRETALYRMLFLQQTTGQAVASAVVTGTKAAEATAVVGANAAEAASGAAASVAPTPFIGPALAAAAFGTVLAMVLGARSSIKSARGGYDIPAGINPVTQLHAEEMVLPAEQANTIRQLGESGGAGGSITVELKGASAGDFFIAHKSELVKAIKAANRGFAFA